MNTSIQKLLLWMQKTSYEDPDEAQAGLYIQAISILQIVTALIIGIVYLFDSQFFYVIMMSVEVVLHGIVVGLVRSGKLKFAANLFLIAALGLLTFGIFSVGGIHASSSLLYPVVLIFASLLLNRKRFIFYGLLCIVSVAFLIFSERYGLTPIAYIPDPPGWPLFITYALIIASSGIVIRAITENLQNSLQKAREYVHEIVTQQSILDRVGQAVIGCSLDNTIIYWNKAATELFDWNSEEVLGKNYNELMQTEKGYEVADEISQSLQNEKIWSGEVKLKGKNQKLVHVYETVMPLRSEDGSLTGWVGTAFALSDHKRVEMELRQREAILEAVAFAAEQFLIVSEWREKINGVLEQLGKTIDATHAYLFEDHFNSKGEPVTSMRYEWTRPGYPSDLDGPHFQNSIIDQVGFEEQVEKLKRGEIRAGTLSTFNEIEKNIMQSLGVKSILEVPIFVNGHEWGAIGFDDFENEREWTTAEVDALKIAAGILSAAIQRQEAETAVRESERIYRQAIETAGAVPYFQDYQFDKYKFMGQGIEQLIGYRADEMSLSLWQSLIELEQLSGELARLKPEEAVQRVRSGEFTYWKADNLIRAKDGSLRWLADTAVELYDESGASYGSLGIIQDITERKRIEDQLIQREALWETIAFAAEKFLRNTDWRTDIHAVLERIGNTMKVTHAYLFEHHYDENGTIVSALSHEWTAPDFPSDFDNPYYQKPHPLKTDHDSVDVLLQNGTLFFGTASSFPEPERGRLLALGVKAMVEMPLFVDGVWWGTIGFDDMQVEREWNSVELDALKIAASVLSAAIQRQRAEVAVRESERIYRQAIEAAGAVPYYQEYGIDRYQFIGNGIRTMLGYEPDEITSSFWDQIVQQYDFVGEMKGIDPDTVAMKVRDGSFDFWRCDYQIKARDGSMKWVADSAIELFRESGISYASIGILQDITERKEVEANLRKREALLDLIAFSAEQFLRASDWREVIDSVLEHLGIELNASHAYLFERQTGPAGETLTSMRNEWTAPGFKSDLEDPVFQNMIPSKEGFERLYDLLEEGLPLVGSSSFFNEREREHWNSLGVKALLEIRVIVGGQQWGVLGFDDMADDREWLPMEVDVVKAAGNVLGAAIKRQLDENALQKELDERRRTEQALRFSEEKFSKAFQATQVLMTIEDEDHIFIDVNKAFEEAVGLSRDTILGRRATDLNILFFTSEDMTLLRDNLKQNNGILIDFEMPYLRANGDKGFILLSSENIRLDNAEYILTSGLDITERKMNEQRIQQLAARAEVLASLSQMLTQVTQDQRSVLDTVVRRCAELIGDGASIFLYSPENEFLELVAVDNPDPNAMEVFRDEIGKRPIRWNEGIYAQAIEQVKPILVSNIPVDELIRRANPERREYYQKLPFHSIMVAPLHAQGDVLGVIGMARHSPGRDYTQEDLTFLQDIADRSALALLNAQYYKKLEEELAERKRAEEKYRSIFDNSIDGIFQSVPAGHFLSVNQAMARIYGYDSPEDMIRNINNIGSQLYVESGQREELQRRLNTEGRLTGYETLDYRKDGSTFWSSMNIQAIFDEHGSLLYYEGTVEDITPRKKAEADREALIQELAKKNTELEQFTYTVSHDLKSPLVTINGFLGYLEQDAFSGNTERMQRDMQRIYDAVKKMQNLLNELLELSRIGRVMNPPEAVPFDVLAREALNLVSGRLDEHHVIVSIQPDLPVVYVDKPRIIEVLQNLLDNAAKYMGPQVNPYVEIGQRGEEQGLPVFYIKDNGIGIAPEFFDRIFGLFNKLDPKSEGTGVGLALVKRIIEVHGGRIWVESSLGHGSTFYFTLPEM